MREWDLTDGPTFDNSVAIMEIEGRHAQVTINRSALLGDPEDTLHPLLHRTLSA
ncbi:MAG: hypothetical protein U0237_20535 [Thermoleophilia bacterium]